MEFQEVIDNIQVYQKKITKYKDINDEAKLIYYLSKLRSLPVRVAHLEQTGVGRFVNRLSPTPGEVGSRARRLVEAWRKVVNDEELAEQERARQQRMEEYRPTQCNSPEDEEEAPLQISQPEEPSESPGDCYNPLTSLDAFKTPTLNGASAKYTGGPNEAGGKYGRSGGVSGSESDLSPLKYNPHTSTEDYNSIASSNHQEYNPTTIADEEVYVPSKMGPPSIPDVEMGEREEALPDLAENGLSANDLVDSKHKSKHKDKKKHKSHSKDRDRHSKEGTSGEHKSSSSSSRDKKKSSHKDKCKEKDRHRSDKSHEKKSKHGDDNSPNKCIQSSSDTVINGHDVDLSLKEQSSSSNKSSKSSSSSKHGSSTSSSKEHKSKDKSKGDKHESKQQKRKAPTEDFGFMAALTGGTEVPPKKKKTSKESSKSKEDKPSSSKSSKDEPKAGSSNASSSGNQADKVESPDIAAFRSPLELPKPKEIISPNYKPLPRIPLPDFPAQDLEGYDDYLVPDKLPDHPADVDLMDGLSEDQKMNRLMERAKNRARTQMYCGQKTAFVPVEVPRLQDICIKFLQNNIDKINYTGGIPYDILKPVLEKATSSQLFDLEYYNSYLLEDTNHLWEYHCKKTFKGEKPQEMETYRELFTRCTDERRIKFEKLTKNITQKKMQREAPQRKVELAFEGTSAKPPKAVARAQARFGTGHGATAREGLPPRQAEAAARKSVLANSLRNDRLQASANRTAQAKKPKAPLMAKSLQFYKKTCRSKR